VSFNPFDLTAEISRAKALEMTLRVGSEREAFTPFDKPGDVSLYLK
jgi:hypothetical protein